MNREESVQAIMEKIKEMSTETIHFQAIADVLGLHVTDHKALRDYSSIRGIACR